MIDVNIALTGMMGAGKSVVADRLAELLGTPVLDLDSAIEERESTTIPLLFESEGEARFREIESDVLQEVCRTHRGVLATGGGTVIDPGNRSVLRRWGRVVYLYAEPEDLAARLALSDWSVRPLLDGHGSLEARLRSLIDSRRAAYEAADHIVETKGLTPGGVARNLVSWLTA